MATPETQPIPGIDFARPDIRAEDYAAVARVLDSGWLTTGDECVALERELAAMVGAGDVVAVSSCTAAMEIAFAFLDLEPGARVGVPTWTFASSALVPARTGLRPVLLDVDPETLNLSPSSLAAALAQGLDAVVAVHFGGVPVDPTIHQLCAQADVPLLEDAAHALGARDERGPIGAGPTVAACYSFYATKNLSCGEGGALATNDAELASFARSFRLHGLSEDAWARYRPGGKPNYDLIGAGLKANLPDLLAALARSQLARFDELQQKRRALVTRYRAALADVPGVGLVPAEQVEGSADHLLVVTLPEGIDRDAVIAHFGTEGIGTSVHFRPLHRFRWFAEHAEIGPTGVAVADALAPRALSLPLHPRMSEFDVDRVSDVLAAAIAAQR